MASQSPLSEPERLITQYHMIPPGAKVLCAVSGGADSVYLLERLYRLQERLNFTLSAAHYNHQLRGEESNRDEAFVRALVADRYGARGSRPGPGGGGPGPVELFLGRGDVAGEAKRRGRGVEETAREMRYRFLRETAARAGADVIATAHNAEDNAETLLMHLIRGTGLQGLCGIAPKRGNLIRPLLTTSRRDIEQALDEQGLPHVEDSSNADASFLRNRIRLQLLPLLEEWNPGFVRRLSAAIPTLRADNAYLNARARELCAPARWEGDALVLEAQAIANAPDALAGRAARLLLREVNGGDEGCSMAHIQSLAALCRSRDPAAQAALPRGVTARREYGRLILTAQAPPGPMRTAALRFGGVTSPENSLWECACMPCTCPHSPPAGVWYLRRDALGADALLRPRQAGDALDLPGRGRRSVKKLLISAKIPRWQRERIPVLADGAGVAGIAGFGCAAQRLARPGESAWAVTFLPKNKQKDGDTT